MDSTDASSVDQLLGMGIRECHQALADPPDAQALIAAASSADLAVIARHYRALWIELLDPDSTVDIIDSAEEDSDNSGEYWQLFRSVGTTYGRAVFALARIDFKFSYEVGLDDGYAQMPSKSSFANSPHPTTLNESRARLREAYGRWSISAFDSYVSGVFLAGVGFRVPYEPGDLPVDSDPDVVVHEAIRQYWDDLGRTTDDLHDMHKTLYGLGLEFMEEEYKLRSRRAIAASGDALRIKELSGLAGRFEPLAAKYGAKKIEQRFEQQLSLLMQSFGFTVVPAATGKPAPDLLCISRTERFTFLVDAKTSKRPYSLPKDDARALADYVDDMGKALGDLPRVRFVLVVGPRPGRTIAAKLKALEVDSGVPIRFLAAELLEKLRQSIVGPVPPDAFSGAILASGPVVSDGLVEKVVQASERVSGAYARFVDDLRAAALAAPDSPRAVAD